MALLMPKENSSALFNLNLGRKAKEKSILAPKNVRCLRGAQ